MKSLTDFVAKILGKQISASEELKLTEAQIEEIDTSAKQEGFALKFMEEHNRSIANDDAIEKITAFMRDENFISSAKSQETVITAKGKTTEELSAVDQLLAHVNALATENKALKEDNKTLAKSPEPDVPIEIVKANSTKEMKVLAHTDTALHGSDESYRALADRPWNKNASLADTNQSLTDFKATEWTTINIDKINQDFGAYARKNSERIVDIFKDGLSLPANWTVVSGISDQIVYAKILVGEISQGRKKKWKPKNKVDFKPVIGKVYDLQIDMEWEGSELQALEKTWLKSRLLDDNGSNPYKMDFVQFLVNKFLVKARHEDKLGLIKGVYFDNNKLEEPGAAINGQSGLFKLVESKKGKEFNPFKLDYPKPTTANILDYHKQMVELIPDAYKNMELQFLISPTWMRRVKAALKFRDGTNTDYKGPLEHVEGFENVKYIIVPQFEGSDFFGMTLMDNIEILVDKVGEEDSVTFQKVVRNIKGFLDYKIGIHVVAFGAQMGKDNVDGYDNQIFWSNDVELLSDVFVPVESNNATPSLEYHNALIIGEENTAPTDITNFTNAIPGKKIYLKGNSEKNKSTVKNNANLLLTGDCVLTSKTVLVLIARSDGKFIELYRDEITGKLEDYQLAADATFADVKDGDRFKTNINTKATGLTEIKNAIKDTTYRITGGGSLANATTLASVGDFKLASEFIAIKGAYIDLYFTGTKFIEVARG